MKIKILKSIVFICTMTYMHMHYSNVPNQWIPYNQNNISTPLSGNDINYVSADQVHVQGNQGYNNYQIAIHNDDSGDSGDSSDINLGDSIGQVASGIGNIAKGHAQMYMGAAEAGGQIIKAGAKTISAGIDAAAHAGSAVIDAGSHIAQDVAHKGIDVGSGLVKAHVNLIKNTFNVGENIALDIYHLIGDTLGGTAGIFYNYAKDMVNSVLSIF